MITALRRLRSVLFSMLLASLLVAQVSAQTKRESDDYQRLVQQALHEFELGNFNEAKAFFAQAHALSPSARTLRGLGMSSYELRNYVEAISYFEQALNATERPLTVQMRGEATRLLGQARGFVTKLKLTVEPASADVRIDTRPVQRDSEGFVLLDPGTHEIVAEAAEHDTTARSLRTDGGESLTLNISLHSNATAANEPKAEPPPEAPASALALSASESGAPRKSSGSELGPWILIGASAAVTVAGGVMIALMVKDKNAVENPSGETTYAEVRGAHDRVFPLSVAGFAALGVGVAGLIGGIAWKVSGGSGDRHSDAQVQLTPGGMRLSGSF